MSLPRKLISASLFAAMLAPFWLTGCSSDEANAVVELCGDLSVPDDIESVRVVIYDQNRTPLRQGVRELWTCPGPTLHTLPQTLEFDPVQGDVFIEVQGLKDGAPVIRSELRTTLSGQENTATVSLERSCMGARCAAGETCVNGKCELVALAAKAVSQCSSGGSAPTPDATSDTDLDTTDATDATDDAGAQPTDAGTSDAGTSDAGSSGRPGAYLCPAEDTGSPQEDAEDDVADEGDASDTAEDAQ